jgi:3-mercaptopyruvate sulfurtransferase SseA
MSDLGVRREMHVVIYDQHGLSMGASRAWWLFHLFGHDRVSVLDGGLTAWLAADLPVESGAAAETTFRPRIEELPIPRRSTRHRQLDGLVLPVRWLAGMKGA